MIDWMSTSQLQSWVAIFGGMVGFLLIGWRIFSYFNEKSKCFELQKHTIRSQNEKIDAIGKKVDKIESNVQDEVDESKKTHIEIFKRLNDVDKKLSYIAGKHGYTDD